MWVTQLCQAKVGGFPGNVFVLYVSRNHVLTWLQCLCVRDTLTSVDILVSIKCTLLNLPETETLASIIKICARLQAAGTSPFQFAMLIRLLLPPSSATSVQQGERICQLNTAFGNRVWKGRRGRFSLLCRIHINRAHVSGPECRRGGLLGGEKGAAEETAAGGTGWTERQG